MGIKDGRFHCHTENSNKDSFASPKALVKKLKEMGARAAAITDHGTMMGVRPFLEECKKAGINGIGGVEVYVSEHEFEGVSDEMSFRKHLVLLSETNVGLHAISLAVTESNKHIEQNKHSKLPYPIMTKKIIQKFFGPGSEGHGHVIMTSACVGGVLAGIKLAGEQVRPEYDELTAKLEKALKAKADVEKLTEYVKELTQKRDELTKLTKKTYAKRKKQAEKLTGSERHEALAKIEAEEKESVEANTRLPQIRTEISKRNKQITELKKGVLNEAEEQKIIERIRFLEPQLMTDEGLKEAIIKEAKWYDEVAGHGNFFIEVQYHGLQSEKEIMPLLAEVARELNIPIIAANDEHMIEKEDYIARSYLNSMRSTTFSYYAPGVDSTEYYVKSDEELAQWLGMILPEDVVQEAMNNLGVIADRCHVEFVKAPHYPKFDPSLSSEETCELLRKYTRKGILEKYPDWDKHPEWEQKLQHELNVICTMGFADYFLIEQDFLNVGRKIGHMPPSRQEYLRQHIQEMTVEEIVKFIEADQSMPGLTIGPGRGSAAGSIVCYATGITSIDPIKFDLLFERFLNPERVSMPDIDSDFADGVRDIVIKYCGVRYGQDGICSIMSRGTLAARSSIDNVAKVHGSAKTGESNAFLSIADGMKKCLEDPSETLSEGKDKILDKYKDSADLPIVKEILDLAMQLEGTFEHIGKHAAGVVISDNGDIKQYLPLIWDVGSSSWKTQWDKEEVESGGLLKMDFLGLINLNVITKCLRLMPREVTSKLNVERLAYNEDPTVLAEIFAKADTDSVFQFESDGMKSMLKKFGPTTFDDLILLVAAYRPGPMQFLDDIIAVKHGRKKLEYLTPQLEHILSKTYGAIVYQEQVQQIFRDLAGYSLGGADLVRRIMGHKEPEKLILERKAFVYGDPDRKDAKGNPCPIHGCVANGIPAEIADKLFDQMSEFAKYAFNKSHAAAYAFVSYITAWLKYYYPVEYYCAAMEFCKREKIAGLIESARKRGVKVHVPDINLSEAEMTIHNDTIYLGFNQILKLGASGNMIMDERMTGDYKTVSDFIKRVKPKKDVMEYLIKAGAFDTMNPNRAAIMNISKILMEINGNIVTATKKVDTLCKIKEAVDNNDMTLATKLNGGKKVTVKTLDKNIENNKKTLADLTAEYNNTIIYNVNEDMGMRLNEEYIALGTYVSAHPLDVYRDETSITSFEEGMRNIKVLGRISGIRKGKKKSAYAFFTCMTKIGEISGACFDESVINQLEDNAVFVFFCNVSTDNKGELQIVIRKVTQPLKSLKLIGYRISSRAKIEQAESMFRNECKCDGNEAYNIRFFIETEGIWHESGIYITEEYFSNNRNRFIQM